MQHWQSKLWKFINQLLNLKIQIFFRPTLKAYLAKSLSKTLLTTWKPVKSSLKNLRANQKRAKWTSNSRWRFAWTGSSPTSTPQLWLATPFVSMATRTFPSPTSLNPSPNWTFPWGPITPTTPVTTATSIFRATTLTGLTLGGDKMDVSCDVIVNVLVNNLLDVSYKMINRIKQVNHDCVLILKKRDSG